MPQQIAVPSILMRGGTSKGLFFHANDLPATVTQRNAILLAAMGSPDKRQIDGLGGAHPLTSKVGIVSLGSQPGIDLEFLFAQLQPVKDTVDTTPNCGNMLAAVVPFALEMGLIEPQGNTSTYRVLTLNTGMAADITVQTPAGSIEYTGDCRIDGVPGTAAPVQINFLDTAGSVCNSLLPTGNVKDFIEVEGEGITPFSIEVTCIDNGMPLVIFRAQDIGCTGYETAEVLNADTKLKQRIEALRLKAAHRMGLGNVSNKNYPKMTLIAPPHNGGAISTRSFIPHVCHDAIGVLAAVTMGTACVLNGSICEGLAVLPESAEKSLSIEHPTGEFTVNLALDASNPQKIVRAALLRTARALMRGHVLVPGSILQDGFLA